MLSWFVHFLALLSYTVTYSVVTPLLGYASEPLQQSYGIQRMLEALKYGSGLDHEYHPSSKALPPKTQ